MHACFGGGEQMARPSLIAVRLGGARVSKIGRSATVAMGSMGMVMGCRGCAHQISGGQGKSRRFDENAMWGVIRQPGCNSGDGRARHVPPITKRCPGGELRGSRLRVEP